MLPTRNRIPSSDIPQVMRAGKRIRTEIFDIRILQTSMDTLRCTVIVSTKIDKRAVVRNRIRRLLSESVRHMVPQIHRGYDVVIRVTRRTPDTQQEVETEIRKCLSSLVRQ